MQCPYCKEEINDNAVKCRFCGEFFDESLKPKQEFATEIKYASNIIIKCPACGYEGRAKKRRKGNGFVELILWLFMIIPGLIYSSRRGSGICSCPKCGNKQVIKKGTRFGFRR